MFCQKQIPFTYKLRLCPSQSQYHGLAEPHCHKEMKIIRYTAMETPEAYAEPSIPNLISECILSRVQYETLNRNAALRNWLNHSIKMQTGQNVTLTNRGTAMQWV